MFNGRRALSLAVGTLLTLSAVGLVVTHPRRAVRGGSLRRGGERAVATTAGPSTTSAPPPPEVAFLRRPADPSLSSDVLVVAGDGSGEHRVSLVPYRRSQVSTAANVLVRSNEADSYEYAGGRCNAAEGCPSTIRSEADIVVANADGSNERKLTDRGFDTKPVLSPDASRVAFVHHTSLPVLGVTDVIEVLDLGGTVVGGAPPPPGFIYIQAAWSPDGRRLAAVRMRMYDPLTAAIDILSLDGTPTRTLVEGPWSDIDWSHDGTRLVGVRAAIDPTPRGPVPFGSDLWLVPVDGGPPTQLTHVAPSTMPPDQTICSSRETPERYVNQPMWAPDDSRIAFLADLDHQPISPPVQDLVTIGVDGTDQRTLHRTPPGSLRAPSI